MLAVWAVEVLGPVVLVCLFVAFVALPIVKSIIKNKKDNK